MTSVMPHVRKATGKPRLTLAERRIARGWTQLELAAFAHVGLMTVTNIESNRRVPLIDTCEKLADALGCTTADIAWPSEASVQRVTRAPRLGAHALAALS